MSSQQQTVLGQVGRFALVFALLVSQAAWVGHGHAPSTSAIDAVSGVADITGSSAELAQPTSDDHQHSPSSDVECFLCLAADLTPIAVLGVDSAKDPNSLRLTAASLDASTLLPSILAYQTRAPPLFATA